MCRAEFGRPQGFDSQLGFQRHLLLGPFFRLFAYNYNYKYKWRADAPD